MYLLTTISILGILGYVFVVNSKHTLVPPPLIDQKSQSDAFGFGQRSCYKLMALLGILPIQLPISDLDCNEYLPDCEYDYPSDHYSDAKILKRSREFLIRIGAQFMPDKSENAKRLNAFFSKFNDCQSDLTITIIGGSLTAGRFVGGYDGAWPKIMETRLLKYRNDTCKHGLKSFNSIKIINNAEPATTSSWALHRLRSLIPSSSDLVVVDYDVNDCAMLQDSPSSRAEMQGITELMVRRILSYTPGGALLFLNVAVNHRKRPLRGECYMLQTCYAMDTIRLPVLQAYQVPLISEKAAVWSNFSCPPPPTVWPCSTFCSHPHEEAHRLLALLVSDFILSGVGPHSYSEAKQLAIANPSIAPPRVPCGGLGSGPLLRSTDDMNNFICDNPVTTIDSRNSPLLFSYGVDVGVGIGMDQTPAASLVQRDSCWKYTSDVAGKPGWVGENCINKSVTFKVVFGSHPSLTLSVLTTYPLSTGIIQVSIAKITVPNSSLRNSSTPKFSDLGVVDLLREDNDYRFYSLTSTIIFDSAPKHVNYSALLCHFYDDADNRLMRELRLEHSAAWIKITQIDGNNKHYLSREKIKAFEFRPSPQKVKVIALHTC